MYLSTKKLWWKNHFLWYSSSWDNRLKRPKLSKKYISYFSQFLLKLIHSYLDLNKLFVIKLTWHCVDTRSRNLWIQDDDYMYSRQNMLSQISLSINSIYTLWSKQTSRKCQLDAYGSTTDPSHKSHHAPVPYSMHHLATEMNTYMHIDVRKWW